MSTDRQLKAPSPGDSDRFARDRFWNLIVLGLVRGGENMALVIAAFLIFQSTHSVVLVGMVLFCFNMPQPFLAKPAIALSNRWGPPLICAVVVSVEGLCTLVLAGIALTTQLSVPMLLAWVAAIGICEGLKQGNPFLIAEILAPEGRLPEFNSARTRSIAIGSIAGMLLSGILFHSGGAAWVYFLAGLCYFPDVLVYGAIHRKSPHVRPDSAEQETLRVAWRYFRSDPGIWVAAQCTAAVFFIASFVVLLPAIASQIGSSAEILSVLEVGTIVGGILVTLVVGRLHGRVGWSRVHMFFAVLAGLILTFMSATEFFGGSHSRIAGVMVAIAAVPLGFAILMNSTVLTSMVQLATPDEHRVSFYTILSLIPVLVIVVGQEAVGYLADQFSIATAFGIMAVAVLAFNVIASHSSMNDHLAALDDSDTPLAVNHALLIRGIHRHHGLHLRRPSSTSGPEPGP